MRTSMSHGNRLRSPSSNLSLRTRFVCVWTSFSTNFWSSLFLLWEWLHPSIDKQCSHTDTEHMTPETLYANQTSSLNRGSPVILSVTLSTYVGIQVPWGRLSISGVKVPWVSSLTSSSKRYCTPNVVSHDCVSMCTNKDYVLHCHLFGTNGIHKHVTHVYYESINRELNKRIIGFDETDGASVSHDVNVELMSLSWLVWVKVLIRRSLYVRSLTGVL